MKIAVIDLGTNTFNMLIAESNDENGFNDIFRERKHVSLASNGIGYIAEAAFGRGLEAMRFYAEKIDEYKVDKIRAIGTAALRTATNGALFVETVKNQTGIQVEVIDGNEEAKLIYEGVCLAYPFSTDYELIMDIGGGSVEFIIANKDGYVWQQSFPIGVAVLRHVFHKEEPISSEEMTQLSNYLDEILQPLWEKIAQFPVDNLIGASGTFDVLENIFVLEKKHPLHAFVSVQDAMDFNDEIKVKTLIERLEFEKIPNERATMIVVAMLLIMHVVERCNIQQIVSSSYAMKEGIMSRMIK